MGSFNEDPTLAGIISDVTTRLSALERTRTIGPPEYKTAFPFGAGWANFGSTFEGASYSKIGRLVVLQGLVTKTGGTPTLNDVIGTLPAGFRPASDLVFGPLTVGNALGRVDVKSTGNVTWIAGGTTEADFTTLTGIAFVVDL